MAVIEPQTSTLRMFKWKFPKMGGGYLIFGVLIIRILLFRVLYWDPLFLETPKSCLGSETQLKRGVGFRGFRVFEGLGLRALSALGLGLQRLGSRGFRVWGLGFSGFRV